MFNSFVRHRAEKVRQIFIQNCLNFDTPRLESEEYPAECKTEMNVMYKSGDHPLELDIYYPASYFSAQECFILIHGGAYVYGSKKLDQNFGMHLAIKSGLPVVNVDYTLMPDSDISQIISEIFAAMNFVYIKYGFKKYHTVGDSAGGYLAYMVAQCARSRHVSHAMCVFDKLRGSVESAAMICPGTQQMVNGFPGLYFEGNQNNKKFVQRLPNYAYNLNLLAERDNTLRVAIIAGENDQLTAQIREFKEYITDPIYFEAENDGDRKMHHVFPIAHPEWPESVKAIELIVKNAKGRE